MSATAPAANLKLMLCADGHDACNAGVSYALRIIEQTENCNGEGSLEVVIYGHVHNDSRVPFIKNIGRAMGLGVTTKEERGEDLRRRGSEIMTEVKAKQGKTTVTMDIDDTDSTMLDAYSQAVGNYQPDILVVNERKDYAEVMKPFWKEVHQIARCSKSPIVTVCKKTPKHHHLTHLLLIDNEFNESSRRLVEKARFAIHPADAVYLLSCWDLPDFATAMYADDHRWDTETKKCEKKARTSIQAAHQRLLENIPSLPHTHVSLHTRNDTVAGAVKHFLSHHHGVEHILVGGSSTILHGTMTHKRHTNIFGNAKRSMFGTTADSLLPLNPGAVTIVY